MSRATTSLTCSSTYPHWSILYCRRGAGAVIATAMVAQLNAGRCVTDAVAAIVWQGAQSSSFDAGWLVERHCSAVST